MRYFKVTEIIEAHQNKFISAIEDSEEIEIDDLKAGVLETLIETAIDSCFCDLEEVTKKEAETSKLLISGDGY